MIISFAHRFIFVKTRKTAGTSVEVALTPFCGPQDILAPLAPHDEALRTVEGVIQARNYAKNDSAAERAYGQAVRAADTELALRLFKSFGAGGFVFSHAPLRLARRFVAPEFWQQAYKFTIERHPYEKAVSTAYFRMAVTNAPASDLHRYVDMSIADVGDSRLYTVDGTVAVDRIIRYENLLDELRQVMVELGLEPPEALPRLKVGSRPDRRPAAEILTPDQKRAIFERCRGEFEMLGYQR
jgi:hypothetical protein